LERENSLASSELVLGIDNSTDFLNLAISSEGQLLEERHGRPFRPSSEILSPEISSILNDRGYSLSDLSLLVVSLGPGSFTGIRVALSCAKGISVALGIPLTGVSTLDLLAWPFTRITTSYICPIIDAKKGEVFFAQYHQEKNGLQRITEYQAARPEELAKTLLTPSILFGSGVRLCEPMLSSVEGVTVIGDHHQRIMGESLIELGTERYRTGNSEAMKPIYGRRSEAEIKFDLTVT
jgi:tRNA threonylcarbamoyladenosine biosynthesis protein TsaB